MSTTQIHPTAVVAPGAWLDEGVAVGPYAVIGEKVRIGRGTRIGNFCVVENDTTMGRDNVVFTGAVVGSIPQDLKFDGAPSRLVIGDRNTIREYVTINISTSLEQPTRIGNNNLIMAYSHVAHDCRVGDSCILANGATLAGHVTLEDRAVVGGLTAIHQFVRMGRMCIVGGCSKVVTDLPPYTTCDGHPARFYGLNLVGLRRAGVSAAAIKNLKAAYKIYFQSGLTKQHALEEIKRTVPSCPEVEEAVAFLSSSQRGICH
ncbi:MAG: acyl-ACP--UDP-N-acetylglucosamine O-acyltransferase [Deltaproteobacteria bacterium]